MDNRPVTPDGEPDLAPLLERVLATAVERAEERT
jgi:hypothetical protein